MSRHRWRLHLIIRALAHRKGRTVLLLAVLAMAASLATALATVSGSMDRRIAEEVRKYGANLVILPESSRLDIGSGGLNFGSIAEPAYLQQRDIEAALARSGQKIDRSLHLKGVLPCGGSSVSAEGVIFSDIRRLFPWWQVNGTWPGSGELLAGVDLARRLKLVPGGDIDLGDGGRPLRLRIAGIVTTGGEEDQLLFLPLHELQRITGHDGQLSLVRLLAPVGSGSLQTTAAKLQGLLPGAKVVEVRQTARTSEGLLVKVKLLMAMVTAVVLISAGSSVTGTMSTTILERSKEIGLMKAMGGSAGEVMLIFCGEALVLGLAGGGSGYLLGAAIAEFITRSVFSAPSGFMPVTVLLSLGTSLFLALFGSIGPMRSVFRLDPVKSLRGE